MRNARSHRGFVRHGGRVRQGGGTRWANTTLVSDDVAVAVPAMRAKPGDPLRVIGSLSLVRSLLRLGLVDRLRIMVFPQILGETGRSRSSPPCRTSICGSARSKS